MKALYHGGSVVTMDERMRADAVLAEDGIIRAVGKEEDLRALAPDAERIDLDGAALLPAFVDAHSHFSQVANAFLQASLDGVESVEEMRRRIQAFVQETRPKAGAWIVARDFDNNLMPGGRYPGMEELNTLAPGHPLVIHHKSGHMGLFNAEALHVLGVTADTPSPEGGRIETKDGKLTGYMEENAFTAFLKKMPAPDMAQLLEGYRMAQQKYLSHGIATVQDGMLVEQMAPMYQELLNSRMLKIDLVAYPDVPSFDRLAKLFGGRVKRYVDHMKIGGVKIFLDGSPQGRTAWMRAPYADDPNEFGYATMTDEGVMTAMDMAAERGVQLLAHTNGDAAAAQFLRCLQTCEKRYQQLKQLRPVLIHGQLMGTDQLSEAARLGAMVSFFVAHVYYWGDVHVKNFGLERAQGISPAASALRAGLPFTFHQDAPVIEPNMLETLWCAVNRTTRSGVLLGKKEKISIQEALKAVTIRAAYQYFEENTKGSITPGKQADFVMLSRDPLQTPPEDLRDIEVLETIKQGERLFSKR